MGEEEFKDLAELVAGKAFEYYRHYGRPTSEHYIKYFVKKALFETLKQGGMLGEFRFSDTL